MSKIILHHTIQWVMRLCLILALSIPAVDEGLAANLASTQNSINSKITSITAIEATITQIATYGWHTCALNDAGEVFCWGRNNHGQLGDGTMVDRHTPVKVQGLPSPAKAIATGREHSCALTDEGGMYCWGNYYGLGDGTTADKSSPVVVSGLDSNVTAITAGMFHSCALVDDDVPYCWGQNYSAMVGDGTLSYKGVPTAVNTLWSGVKALTAGDHHTCALLDTGGVKCWGGMGLTGDGGDLSGFIYLPRQVVGMTSGVASVVAGGNHTCLLKESGEMLCWGANALGELSNSKTIDTWAPLPVEGLTSKVSKIAVSNYTCVITESSEVECWGELYPGKVAPNTQDLIRYKPRKVVGLDEGVVTLTTGYEHACAITTDNKVKCWGKNTYGQLGNGSVQDFDAAYEVTGLGATIKNITAGGDHTCALTEAGGALCWGDNSSGQLGDGTHTDRRQPTQVSGLNAGISALAAGDNHTCALNQAGTLLCWGSNSFGQLGDGTNEDHSTPETVEELEDEDIQAITAGGGHTCALTNAGGVYCWGNNSKGQLGDGSNDNRNEPRQVSGLSSGVKAIAAGWNFTCAVLDSGNAKCWGDNSYGQIDFNNYAQIENPPTSSNTPVEIPLKEISWVHVGATAITAGYGHVCAITDYKTIVCWGANFADQLGRPPSTPFVSSTTSAPHEIPPNTSFTAVRAGFAHNCALTEERTLYCWGLYDHGQLADESNSVAIARLNNVTAIATGDHHSCAFTEAGKTYCWGKNDSGQLGNGSEWSPVTVTVAPSTFTRQMFLPSVQTEP